jgi:hypothetical protein
VVTVALLALLLSGELPEEEEVRGVGGAPVRTLLAATRVSPQTMEARQAPRLRFGVAAAAIGGFTYGQPTGGVGFSLDLGVMLIDRLAVFFHGELGTFFYNLIGSVGVAADYAITDRWSVGAGGAFTTWAPLGNWGSERFIGLTFPLRVNFALQERAPDATRRFGLMLGWHLAPGFSLIAQNPFNLPGPQAVQGSVTAGMTFGYAWW